MLKKLIVLLLALFVIGCNDPKDIILGPEPLKQIAEQGDKFKKLSEEDRTLLAGYLTVMEMGKAFGVDVKPVTGRTVGEVLTDARIWKEKIKASDEAAKKKNAEEEALKNKILAERDAVSKKISNSVVVAIVEKNVLPKNYSIGRFNEMLSLKYAIQNKSEKAIKQLKGQVTFNDATGDEIGILYVDIDETIDAGQTHTTTTGRGWELNQFLNGSVEKIAQREFSAMTASFAPESIAYEDGEILKSPSLP